MCRTVYYAARNASILNETRLRRQVDHRRVNAPLTRN